MKRPFLCVLDQWASQNTALGTSKNWLYAGLEKAFTVEIINADLGFPSKYQQLCNLTRAFFSHPITFRKHYHLEQEWAPKRLAACKARTKRFRKRVQSLAQHPNILLQIGDLFGPLSIDACLHVSYHDQNVSQVEQYWPAWLPENFTQYNDRWYQYERSVLQSKHLVLTYSACTRHSMIATYGLDPLRVRVAHTACKMPFPTVAEVMAPRREAILFASTDFWRKGGDIVLEVFQRLRTRRPTLELLMVGGPAPHPLPEGARHLGTLSQTSLQKLYLSSALILHPARHDAFPNVLKEAQACGLPAVASDSMGIPEIVLHGHTGLILKKLDCVEWAETVDALLGDPARLFAMREACLRERSRFLPEHCVGVITDAVLEQLDRMPPA